MVPILRKLEIIASSTGPHSEAQILLAILHTESPQFTTIIQQPFKIAVVLNKESYDLCPKLVITAVLWSRDQRSVAWQPSHTYNHRHCSYPIPLSPPSPIHALLAILHSGTCQQQPQSSTWSRSPGPLAASVSCHCHQALTSATVSPLLLRNATSYCSQILHHHSAQSQLAPQPCIV